MNKPHIYELKPNLYPQKSFYGKATITEYDNRLTLDSYRQNVAYIEDGVAVVLGVFGTTTTRHIKEFLSGHNFKIGRGKWMFKKYGKSLKLPKNLTFIDSDFTNEDEGRRIFESEEGKIYTVLYKKIGLEIKNKGKCLKCHGEVWITNQDGSINKCEYCDDRGISK